MGLIHTLSINFCVLTASSMIKRSIKQKLFLGTSLNFYWMRRAKLLSFFNLETISPRYVKLLKNCCDVIEGYDTKWCVDLKLRVYADDCVCLLLSRFWIWQTIILKFLWFTHLKTNQVHLYLFLYFFWSLIIFAPFVA